VANVTGLGVEYQIVDRSDCSPEEWKEARDSRPDAEGFVRALRALGEDDAHRMAIDILTRSGLQMYGLDRIQSHELFAMIEQAIRHRRILVSARRETSLVRATGARPPPKPEPAMAKGTPLDKFIRVLLFDCQGGAVPSKSGPPSARIEVRTQTGATYSASVAGGKADVTGIPAATPSACQIVFLGVADGNEPVPAELPAAPAPANARTMAQGFSTDPILVTRRQIGKVARFDAWSDSALLRVSSEDGRQVQTYPLSQATAAGTLRAFTLVGIVPGTRYRGDMIDEDLYVRVFEYTVLGQIRDRLSPLTSGQTSS
jgi:hypothetical protein